MSTLPMQQIDHPAHNVPKASEAYEGKTLPTDLYSNWIDKKEENDSAKYSKPVTTGDDFIP